MYRLTENPSLIIRLSDNAFVPAIPSNIDYQEYLAWLAQGNEPLPFVPTPPPPPRLPMVQFRLNLLAAGYLEQVEAFMSGPAATKEAQIFWEYSTEVHRNDPILLEAAATMGFTEAQIDEFFN